MNKRKFNDIINDTSDFNNSYSAFVYQTEDIISFLKFVSKEKAIELSDEWYYMFIRNNEIPFKFDYDTMNQSTDTIYFIKKSVQSLEIDFESKIREYYKARNIICYSNLKKQVILLLLINKYSVESLLYKKIVPRFVLIHIISFLKKDCLINYYEYFFNKKKEKKIKIN